MMPELLLLASTRQFGAKFSYWNERLYHPGDKLGWWQVKPKNTWDCRQALRFLYHSKIMLADGLPEMALSASIACLENATAEILLYLLNSDKGKVETELRKCRFLDRFDKLLPKFGVRLPNDMFKSLKLAYFARNGIIHGLRPISFEKARNHLQDIEDVLVWYWENVGEGAPKPDEKGNIPF
jgi:hypothetical protein